MQTQHANETEFYAELKGESDQAYCFFDGCEEFWLPKSCCTIVQRMKGRDVEAKCPEWLAKKKGII